MLTRALSGSGGSGEKPTLLASNNSGATSLSFNPTPYTYLIIISGRGGFSDATLNSQKRLCIEKADFYTKGSYGIQVAYSMSSGANGYGTAIVSSSGISFAYNEGNRNKFYAVYGVKTDSFDLSEIMQTWYA